MHFDALGAYSIGETSQFDSLEEGTNMTQDPLDGGLPIRIHTHVVPLGDHPSLNQCDPSGADRVQPECCAMLRKQQKTSCLPGAGAHLPEEERQHGIL